MEAKKMAPLGFILCLSLSSCSLFHPLLLLSCYSFCNSFFTLLLSRLTTRHAWIYFFLQCALNDKLESNFTVIKIRHRHILQLNYLSALFSYYFSFFLPTSPGHTTCTASGLFADKLPILALFPSSHSLIERFLPYNSFSFVHHNHHHSRVG